MIDTLVMVLAGGKGERLHPLTADRAKPAVPFGARYRIVDFVLSNLINSGFFRIKVLTQYRSNSLLVHLARGYNFGSLSEHYVDAIPAQQGGDFDWYKGTAGDLQNRDHRRNPTTWRCSAAPSRWTFADGQYHRDRRGLHGNLRPADRTTAAGRLASSRSCGLAHHRLQEKPPSRGRFGQPDGRWCHGQLLLQRAGLGQMLAADHRDAVVHDFGRDVVPQHQEVRVYAYNFLDNKVPGETGRSSGYWRDVGTVDSYYEANMDLRAVEPLLNLYNYEWPIRSTVLQYPPVKFVFDDEGWRGMAVDSIVANGTIVSGPSAIRGLQQRLPAQRQRRAQHPVHRLQHQTNMRLTRVICSKYVRSRTTPWSARTRPRTASGSRSLRRA
jgi:glucose-1-phosphate adenylyltransferase